MVGNRQLAVFGVVVLSGLTGGALRCDCDGVGLADSGVLSGFSFSDPTATEARAFERLSFILSRRKGISGLSHPSTTYNMQATYLVIGSTTKLNAFPPLLLLVPFPVLAWSSVPAALAPPLATERFDMLVSGALVGGVGIPPPAPIPAIPAPAFELVSLPFRLGRFLLSSFSFLSSPLESFPWSNFEMLNRSMDIPRPCLLGLPLLVLGVDVVLVAGLSATGDWRGVVVAGTGTSWLITRGGVGREVRLSLVGL